MTPDAFDFNLPFLIFIAEREFASCQLHEQYRPSDAVQQAYLQAHLNRDQFQGTTEAEWRAWLKAILINEIRQMQRQLFDTEKRNVRKQVSLSAEAFALLMGKANESPSQFALGNETQSLLQQAFQELKPRKQEIIRLRLFEEKEFTEIATILAKDEPAARKYYERAMDEWYSLYKKKIGK